MNHTKKSILIGRIFQANELKSFFEKEILKAEKDYEDAKSSAKAFSQIDDCSDIYDAEKRSAEKFLNEVKNFKHYNDKQIKTLKDTFKELYPEDIDLIKELE